MSRTEIERQARRNYILEAARRLFAEQDLENGSMDDIAAAAEYTRRTLYSYFKTRDELYLLIHMEDTARRQARQQEALKAVEGGLAKILAWAETLFAFCREHPQALRMEGYWDFHGVDRQRISPAIFRSFEKLNEGLAEDLRAIFRLGIADGSLRPDLDVDMGISQFLYSLRAVTGRALSSAYSFAEFDSDAYLHHYLDLFSRGVGNQGEPQ